MYIILQRNGLSFGSEGMYYVIKRGDVVVFQDMNKRTVEQEFMKLSR